MRTTGYRATLRFARNDGGDNCGVASFLAMTGCRAALRFVRNDGEDDCGEEIAAFLAMTVWTSGFPTHPSTHYNY